MLKRKAGAKRGMDIAPNHSLPERQLKNEGTKQTTCFKTNDANEQMRNEYIDEGRNPIFVLRQITKRASLPRPT
ncbi:hypothetical protein NECAME_05570 [Necator americanus]|uniref:Uncharacterized protein n=1 Tax=Necator americanus TaxID=51031 RepID=W2SIA4_NECAM|nr:hypothetical protein NECAME_05570 [Necator americanus]ETN68487.1 hypothetical protein NECAME_05570 [Necator americanus]